MLRNYWNVASVDRLEKLNSDVEEVLECSKCERTREMKLWYWGIIGILASVNGLEKWNSDVKEVLECSK